MLNRLSCTNLKKTKVCCYESPNAFLEATYAATLLTRITDATERLFAERALSRSTPLLEPQRRHGTCFRVSGAAVGA